MVAAYPLLVVVVPCAGGGLDVVVVPVDPVGVVVPVVTGGLVVGVVDVVVTVCVTVVLTGVSLVDRFVVW